VTDLSAAISAEVPATAEFVQVLRNVAAGVAARLDMPIDQIEEVRLAVTEAASLLLTQVGPMSLRMTIRRDPGTIDITLSCDGAVDPWPSDGVTSSWAWLVMQGLTDEVRLDRGGDGAPAIGFVKRNERVAR
jgi:serine/threonine-protein kinase RsbW